mmetsp:Transcript_15374/g.33810  ORF Transcript_15374/g.33810 Transcript_15374/m.33810 type:complete len:315 (-) Transcript_15374:127-1071(-)
MRCEILVEIIVGPVIGQVENEKVAARRAELAPFFLPGRLIGLSTASTILTGLSTTFTVVFHDFPLLSPLPVAVPVSVFQDITIASFSGSVSAWAVTAARSLTSALFRGGRRHIWGRRFWRIELWWSIPLGEACPRVVVVGRAVVCFVLCPHRHHWRLHRRGGPAPELLGEATIHPRGLELRGAAVEGPAAVSVVLRRRGLYLAVLPLRMLRAFAFPCAVVSALAVGLFPMRVIPGRLAAFLLVIIPVLSRGFAALVLRFAPSALAAALGVPTVAVIIPMVPAARGLSPFILCSPLLGAFFLPAPFLAGLGRHSA